MIVALVSHTHRVSARELYGLAKAMEINARHVNEAWDFAEPVAVVAVDREDDLPPGAWVIAFVDEGTDQTALAEHYRNVSGVAAARVYCAKGSGLNDGEESISESASHELAEMLGNPNLVLWLPHPTRPGVEVARELADPLQDFYEVETLDADGRATKWKMANFVTRFWFMSPDSIGEAVNLDHAGRLSVPGEIGPDGYCVMRARAADCFYHQWLEDLGGKLDAAALSPRKRDAMARTHRLGAA